MLAIGHDGHAVVGMADAARRVARLLAAMLDGRLHLARLDIALPLPLVQVPRADDLDRARGRAAGGAWALRLWRDSGQAEPLSCLLIRIPIGRCTIDNMCAAIY